MPKMLRLYIVDKINILKIVENCQACSSSDLTVCINCKYGLKWDSGTKICKPEGSA